MAIVERLRQAGNPRERVSAVIAGNFAPDQFQPSTISAWLAFYVQAQTVSEARRLHRIYARRLKSNLVHGLALLIPRDQAADAAEGAAALIDGLWIRYALADNGPDPTAAIALVESFVQSRIERGQQ